MSKGGSITKTAKNFTIKTEKFSQHAVAGDIVLNTSSAILAKGKKKGIKCGPYDPCKGKLQKFLVHFRRPEDYNGEYGFDWLRDEYIYPIRIVEYDNNGTSIGIPKGLCKAPEKLVSEYCKDIKNSIKPYGRAYYPAWLSLFPHVSSKKYFNVSGIHKNGIDLTLELEELEPLENDNTEILFEPGNKYLRVKPEKIMLSEFINSGKKSIFLGENKTRDLYKLKKKINVKCVGGVLSTHEEIKVFAQLEKRKEEVGKLMIYKNDLIPKAEFIVVNVETSNKSASLRKDYKNILKYQSFNQALINAEVVAEDKFDTYKLPSDPIENADVVDFKMICRNNISQPENFTKDLVSLYERYGKYSPKEIGPVKGNSIIDSGLHSRTYMFITDVKGADNRVGQCSLRRNLSSGKLISITWGNAYVVFSNGVNDKDTFIHEAGHTFSLPHTFQESDGLYKAPHVFFRGYTDNYMDYDTTVDENVPNIHGEKLNTFFKWQWDIMRKDRSLVY